MKWDAEMYDTVKAPQADAGRELIALANIRKGDSILDIGCGTGSLTIELTRLASGGYVTGIDPSEEMIHKAKETCAAANNISLLPLTAQAINLRERFDIVFSNSAMQWIREQEEVLRSVYLALKKGGRIAFQFPAKNFCTEFKEYIRETIDECGLKKVFEKWNSPWSFPSAEEYGLMLKRTGFFNSKVFVKEYDITFPSVNETIDWWKSAGLRPFLAELNKKEGEYFTYAVAMKFERNRTEKGIEFTFKRLFAFGEK